MPHQKSPAQWTVDEKKTCNPTKQNQQPTTESQIQEYENRDGGKLRDDLRVHAVDSLWRRACLSGCRLGLGGGNFDLIAIVLARTGCRRILDYFPPCAACLNCDCMWGLCRRGWVWGPYYDVPYCPHFSPGVCSVMHRGWAGELTEIYTHP